MKKLLIGIFITLFTLSITYSTINLQNLFLNHPIIPVLHNLHRKHIQSVEILTIMKDYGLLTTSLRHSEAINSWVNLNYELNTKSWNNEIGASTVSDCSQIKLMRNIKFISTTKYCKKVLDYCHNNQISVLCGVSTTEEARNALLSHAFALKFYPTSEVNPEQLKSILNEIKPLLLSQNYPIIVAGGVKLEDMKDYMNAGATGFAIGVDCSQINEQFINLLHSYSLMYKKIVDKITPHD